MTKRNPGFGVALCAEVDGDLSSWKLEWQKAPDDGGSPDVAQAQTIQTLQEGERRLVHRSGLVFVGSQPPWYRCRTVRGDCSTPGDWSDWVQVSPESLAEDIAPCPQPAVGPPTLDVEQTSSGLILEEHQATASEHPDSDAGSGGLELRYRTRIEGKDWGDWQPGGSGGWTSGVSVAISVTRHASQQTFVEIQARDTALEGSPRSETRTITVKSIQDVIDLPPLGRGPLEDDYGRGGMGGETPGGQRVKTPVFDGRSENELIGVEQGRARNLDVEPSVFLQAGVQQSDGARAGNINKATEFTDLADGVDGNGITFSSAYAEEPSIQPLPGYLTSHSAFEADDQQLDVRAVDVTTSGFTVRAKVVKPGSGASQESVDFESDTIGDVGTTDSDFSADVDHNNPPPFPADDDKYTYHGSLNVTCVNTEFGCTSRQQSIRMYSNDGSGWVYRASDSISCECSSNSKDVEETISISGMQAHSGKEFAVGEGVHTGGGYSMDEVTWQAGASGSDDRKATGDSDQYPIQFAVYAKQDG